MKIAIDCHTLEINNWTGKEKYLFLILEELKKDKENNYILYFRRKIFGQSDFPKNFTIVNINIFTPLWQLIVILDLLKRKVGCLFVPCTYLLPALNIFRRNIIVIHDLTTLLQETKATHKWMTRFKEKLLLGAAIKNSTKIITVSESTKKDCRKYFKVDSSRISAIPLAADPRFREIDTKIARENIYLKYNIKRNFILFVGTLEPRKNIEGLIYAFAKLRESLTEYPSLLIVGKRGWYWKNIFKTVKTLSLEKDVIFTGYVPDSDLLNFYNAALFFIYPSFYEGFGLPVLEAMACGCPVITSNISSLPEVAGNVAILIEPTNIGAISDSINELIKNKNLRQKMIINGIDRANKFSWAKTTCSILDIIKKYNLT